MPKTSARDLRLLRASIYDKLDEVLAESKPQKLTPAAKRARRAKADASDLDFCKVYYPHLFDKPWAAVHEHIASLKRGNYSVSGFRRCGKSAFTIVGKLIKRIAKGGQGMCGIGNRTQTPARERTASVARLITKNAALCYDYGISLVQDEKGWYIFNSEGGDTHLVAGSVNMGLRNFIDDNFDRFAFLLLDDLYDRHSVKSEADNKRVFNWIEAEAWGQMETDGLCITLGNMITDDCPGAKLRRAYPEQHYSFPILDDDNNPNWPEVYPFERCLAMQAGTDGESPIPFDVWEAEYMDRPAPFGEVFQPEWIEFVPVATNEVQAAITVIDPSFGQSPAACDKAAITLGLLANGHVVVLRVYVAKEPYSKLFAHLYDVQQHTPKFKANLWENDFAQWSHAEPYHRIWETETGKVLRIIRFNAKDLFTEFRNSDKESRIIGLVHPHQMGQFVYADYLEQNPHFKRYKRQLLSFGEHGKAKLDGPDAAASAYILIRQYAREGKIRTGGTRRFKPSNMFRGRRGFLS